MLAWLSEAERAAEARDVGGLTERVSEDYADARGNDRAAVRAVLIQHFLRNQTVHLITHVEQLELEAPDRAQVVLFVAMAGGPMQRPQDLARLRSSLYRFELTLLDEGGGGDGWRVTRADWRRASTGDTGLL